MIHNKLFNIVKDSILSIIIEIPKIKEPELFVILKISIKELNILRKKYFKFNPKILYKYLSNNHIEDIINNTIIIK